MKFLDKLNISNQISYKQRLKIKELRKNSRSIIYSIMVFFQTGYGKLVKISLGIALLYIDVVLISKTWYYMPLDAFIFPIKVIYYSKDHQVKEMYDSNISYYKMRSSSDQKYL